MSCILYSVHISCDYVNTMEFRLVQSGQLFTLEIKNRCDKSVNQC